MGQNTIRNFRKRKDNDMIFKNGEGYPDPTAYRAIKEADRPPKPVKDVINILRTVASLAGFEIIGRIHLRDRETGREW